MSSKREHGKQPVAPEESKRPPLIPDPPNPAEIEQISRDQALIADEGGSTPSRPERA
ncbi:MAG TPA: hypothetical protein VMI52_12665 [Acetobacteraceae bacterium]|nr:hypothetical protein [Acetobacteraceae bacterium]